jgi:hypothetical protein
MMKLPHQLDVIVYKSLLLLISIILLIFMVKRTAEAAFTFDEAATYLNYISASPVAIFKFNSANNHLVNTLLAKLAWTLGGSSEFVLRLPNLLAFAVYLLFSFLILDRFVKNKIIAVCGYLLLSLNPYVLDFFSLCRGYGLSLAFLMASLFFFFSFLDNAVKNKPDRHRLLNLSLAAAALAVLSNFSLLNVYISLAFMAFAFFAVRNRRDRGQGLPPAEPSDHQSGKRKLFLPVLVLLAAVLFNLLVICQDLTLAQKFFEPVTVRITGLDEPDRDSIDVFRVDIKNQETRLPYQGELWMMDKPAYFTAVKFRCLPDLLSKIKQIEIRIGPETFGLDAFDLKRIRSLTPKKYSTFYSPYAVALKRSIIPVFRPVINWKGDRAFFPYFLLRALLVLGIFVLFVGFLLLSGRLLRRWKLLKAEQFRVLASMTLVLAAFIGYPLYILKKSGELLPGGQTGFIRDTVFSLINNSFYGNLYFRRQEWAVFSFICLILLASLVLFIVHARKRTLAEVLPGFSIFSILILTSISTLLQRALLDNLYLIGRTALFFIPLFMLLAIFLLQYLSRRTTAMEIISICLLAALTLLFVTHFSMRASTAMTVEWRSDADTKSMLKDLRAMKDKDPADHPKIVVGISDIFFPSMQYYLKRGNSTWLEVNTAPPYQGNDFYYLEDTLSSTRRILPRMILLETYPLSGNVLVRPKIE